MNARFLPFLISAALLLGACGAREHAHEDEHADDHGAEAAEFERGPHGGRLLRDGDFALEVTIFETGVPPQFHLYAYRNGEALPAQELKATIELARLGGKVDRFEFKAEGDHLVGDGTVAEPHSFDVTVTARHGDRDHRWSYESYEGRISMPAAVAKAAGVTVETAGPAVIRNNTRLMGRVVLNGDRYAEVKARFPGPVQSVHVNLGDTVRRGQTLATVENRDSLRSYAVTAPINGVVLARHTNAGDVASDGPLFEIGDLSELWLELHAFGEDAARLRSGQVVRLEPAAGGRTVETTLQRVLPLASATSQTVVARALLPNPTGEWRPGMAVNAAVTLAERQVPLAVKTAGLQRFRDFTVVFAQVGDTYEVRMLELGERDGEWVEVLGGIDPGTPYVVEQSFLIKADIEKSGASHDH
jgi:membrane fusion protein, heavy metal efflux system